MSACRLAVRVAGASVLWGGAWWTAPWICAAGAALIALTVVDVRAIGTHARRLVHRGLAHRGTSLYGLSDSLSHKVVIVLLVIALIDVVVLYFAGHDIRGYLTENSDLLYLPTLFVDITS